MSVWENIKHNVLPVKVPHNIACRANAIIECNLDIGRIISPLRLQKLLYIDYGEYLARGNSFIENIQFQAWQYGPVVPEVYFFFKNYTLRKNSPNNKISKKIPSAEDHKYYTLIHSEKNILKK